MLTIGVDAHKRVHVAIALDEAGRELSHWRGPNTPSSWEERHRWANGLGADRHWGIEGAWNYGRGLAQYLVAAGEVVFEVNPRWTAVGRRSARKPGKSDALDARSVALQVWREARTLPRVAADDEAAVLDLLVTEREGAVTETTRLRSQIHQLLLQIEPDYQQRLPNLQTQAGISAVEQYETDSQRPLDQERAAAIRRLAQRLRLALTQAEELAEQIRTRAQAGFSPVAAEVASGRVREERPAGFKVGEVGRPMEAEAAHLGLAPIGSPEEITLPLPNHRGHSREVCQQGAFRLGAGGDGVDREAAEADHEGVGALVPGDPPLQSLHAPVELLQVVVGPRQARES